MQVSREGFTCCADVSLSNLQRPSQYAPFCLLPSDKSVEAMVKR